MHLCGYGPGHSAQLDTPALVTGAAPSAPTVGSGRRSAVSSACGFLSASHHPAPLWQGPTLTTPRLHVFRNIKYHHFSPLSRSCFAFFRSHPAKQPFWSGKKATFPRRFNSGFPPGRLSLPGYFLSHETQKRGRPGTPPERPLRFSSQVSKIPVSFPFPAGSQSGRRRRPASRPRTARWRPGRRPRPASPP